MVAVLLRIVMSAVLSIPQAVRAEDGAQSLLYGADTALFAIGLTVCVAAIDRRRVGARDLMENLGYSRATLLALSAVPPTVIELTINILAAAK